MLVVPTELYEKSTELVTKERAWHYPDILRVLEYLQSTAYPFLILGGDVWDIKCNPTTESWYYEPSFIIDGKANRQRSFDTSIRYIKNLVGRDSAEFLFTLVVSDWFQVLKNQ